MTQRRDVYTVATTGTTWVKPANFVGTTLTIKVWGAGGGGNNGPDGGGGGFARGDLDVTSIGSVQIRVGGGGTGSTTVGAGGGGYSAVFDFASNPYIIAGGGGGAGATSSGGAGGAGGGTTGGSGGTGTSGTGPGVGGGGGQSAAGGAGGTGGSTASDGSAGASLTGGAGGRGDTTGSTGAGAAGGTNGGAAGGSSPTDGGGGGGGGGYYGGGGGEGAAGTGTRHGGGGGGGSNYVGGVTNATNTQASGATAANAGDADYAGSAGAGGTTAGGNGSDGRVVLIYEVYGEDPREQRDARPKAIEDRESTVSSRAKVAGALIVALTAYSSYAPGPDIVLQPGRSTDVPPIVEHFAPQKAPLLTVLTQHGYVYSIQGTPQNEILTAERSVQPSRSNLVTTLTAYAAYDAAPDIVLGGRVVEPVEKDEYLSPRVVSPLIRDTFYRPERDTVLLNRQAKDIWPLDVSEGRTAPLVVVLTDYSAPPYDATNDVVLRNRQDREAWPPLDYGPGQAADLVVALTEYPPPPYDAAVDLVRKRPRVPVYAEPDCDPREQLGAPIVSVLTGYPSPTVYGGAVSDTFVTERSIQPPRSALLTTLTTYTPPVYDPAVDVILKKRRADFVQAPFEHAPARRIDLVATISRYPAAISVLGQDIGRYENEEYPRPRRAPDLVVVLTTYVPYNAGPDIVLAPRAKTTVYPEPEFIQARNGSVLSPVQYPYVAARDIVLDDRRAKDIWPAPDYGPGRVAPLVVALTTYTPPIYDPAIDLVRISKRSQFVSPPIEFERARKVDVIRLSHYDADLVYLSRDFERYETDEHIRARRTPELVVALTTYTPYDPAPDLVLKKRRSDYVSPSFEFEKARRIDLVGTISRYPAPIAVLGAELERYDLEQWDQPRRGSLIVQLTTYVPYDPSPDIVLRGQARAVLPLSEHLLWQRPSRIVTDAVYRPELDAVLRNRQSRHYEVFPEHIVWRGSRMPTALFDPSATPFLPEGLILTADGRDFIVTADGSEYVLTADGTAYYLVRRSL